jgi:hypothetical protein
VRLLFFATHRVKVPEALKGTQIFLTFKIINIFSIINRASEFLGPGSSDKASLLTKMKNRPFPISHQTRWTGRISVITLCLSFFCAASQASESRITDRIKGASRPITVQLADGARCYAYKNFVVFARPVKNQVGEDIVVYKRPVNVPKNLTRYMEIKNDFSNSFAGLAREALFIISETGPDGTLKIYDLAHKKQVFGSGYADGSLKITNNYLAVDKLLPTPVHKLLPSEANAYPKVKQWMDQGGSAGWFAPVHISLETYRESSAGQRWLRDMQ